MDLSSALTKSPEGERSDVDNLARFGAPSAL